MFEEDGIYGNCSTDTSDNNTSCGFQGCNRLRIKLTANFGAHWRTLFFGSLHTHEFDIGELQDLVLLMTLGSPGSAVARLYHLLGQSGHGGRFANHLVCGWRLATSQAFPPEAVAAELLSCVDLLLSSRHGCRCGMELWECPHAILALLRVRLGCRLASGACCTLVCWLGICCSNAADCPGKYVLCDSAALCAVRCCLSGFLAHKVMLFVGNGNGCRAVESWLLWRVRHPCNAGPIRLLSP